MTTYKAPLISIVIPVKNGASTLDTALRGILSQTLADQTEIIIIDSGSSDGTLEIAKRYSVRVHEIPPHEFNHGLTRNLGVTLAQGDFVVMTVQDAYPADDRWLETMLRHFNDPEVAGVCGKQITPHDQDKNPMEWHRPYSAPQVTRHHFPDPISYHSLRNTDRLSIGSWDDVTAMYRKSALIKLPFRTTMFGEDFFWAADALAASLALVHDDLAMVFHYHDQPFVYRFKRMLTIYYHQYQLYGCLQSPSPWLHRIAQSAWHILRHRQLTYTRKFYWIFYNMRILGSEWSAYHIIRSALVIGGKKSLDSLHGYICPFAPQAKLKTKISS
jgi:rhamnosyltransferase